MGFGHSDQEDTRKKVKFLRLGEGCLLKYKTTTEN